MTVFPRRKALQVVETLLIAALGGIIFTKVGVPAGLVSGSVLAVAVAALLGRPVSVPLPLARVFFILVGILLGGVVTPETLKGIAAWPLSIAVLSVAALCMMVATASYLRIVHGWDPLSALLGASPGSLAQVMVLSAEYGADLRKIAIVQTVRVVLLTVGLPAGLALFGLASASAALPLPQTPGAPLGELLILVVVSTLTALIIAKLRLPGGLLFGALIGSGFLHGGGFIQAVLPWWLMAIAVIGLGAVTGARFANTSLRMLLSCLGAALGSFAVAISIATAFIVIVVSLFPLRVADVVIAFAPGAQDTMMVLALALRLDPVFVAAHHLSRFMVVSVSVPIFVRRIARSAAPKIKPSDKPDRTTPDD